MTIETGVWTKTLVAAAGLCAAASIAFGFQGALSVSDDLSNILSCVESFWQRKDLYRIWVTFQADGGTHPGAEPNYLPSLYILLGPLLWLDWTTVKILVALANIACGAGLIMLLQRLYLPDLARWQTLFLILAFFASTPFRSLLLHGQTGVFALLAIFGALYFLQQNKRGWSLVMLALGVTKYSVGAPLSLVFAKAGRWRIFFAAAFVQIALLVLGAYWIGSDPITLFRQAIESNNHLRHQGYMNYSNILLVFGDAGGNAGVLLSAVIVAAAILIAFLRKHEDDLLCLTLFSLASILSLYHGTYDMAMFAVPLVYALRTLRTWDRRDWLERSVAILLALAVFLVWWGLEVIETLVGHIFARRDIGLAQFDERHVAEPWYVLMIAVTLALLGLFALVWRSSRWRWTQ